MPISPGEANDFVRDQRDLDTRVTELQRAIYAVQTRSLVSSNNRIVVTNPMGTEGNPTVAAQQIAFAAYRSAPRSVNHNTWTSLLCEVEQYDLNNAAASYYDTTTGKFTPLIAGKYRLGVIAYYTSATVAGETIIFAIYKNGGEYLRGYAAGVGGAGGAFSVLVEANGSTDFFEAFAYQTIGAGTARALVVGGAAGGTYFQGELVYAT